MKYIYTHLGLGDHIICNGLVRSLINENEVYCLFVKSHNRNTVEFMFRDLNNIKYIEGDDDFVHNHIKNNSITNDNLIIAGFYNHPNANDFAESFYLQNNLPISYRWDKFYVKRDVNKEKEIFDFFNVKEDNYIFIHDDVSRGFLVDEDLIKNKDLPIIRPIIGLTTNVFDYCYLMENSKESHFIDSSFRLIFDCMLLRNHNIYYHIKMKNGNQRNFDCYSDAKSCGLNFEIIE